MSLFIKDIRQIVLYNLSEHTLIGKVHRQTQERHARNDLKSLISGRTEAFFSAICIGKLV